MRAFPAAVALGSPEELTREAGGRGLQRAGRPPRRHPADVAMGPVIFPVDKAFLWPSF